MKCNGGNFLLIPFTTQVSFRNIGTLVLTIQMWVQIQGWHTKQMLHLSHRWCNCTIPKVSASRWLERIKWVGIIRLCFKLYMDGTSNSSEENCPVHIFHIIVPQTLHEKNRVQIPKCPTLSVAVDTSSGVNNLLEGFTKHRAVHVFNCYILYKLHDITLMPNFDCDMAHLGPETNPENHNL